METAIKKAIEGGWKWIIDGVDYTEWVGDKYEGPTNAEIREDPTFWQCLGKAMGWKVEWGSCGACFLTGFGKRSPDCMCKINSWKQPWHQFIDHLAERKDADSFFQELLK